jgi:hypothetical protein
MTWENMFTTDDDLYQRDDNTGLWHRFGSYLPEVYVGSINPQQNKLNVADLLIGMSQKKVWGLVPQFVKGNVPLGLACNPNDIIETRAGHLEVDYKFFLNGCVHLGNPIIEVYNQQ